jgi:WD40 repeat protein
VKPFSTLDDHTDYVRSIDFHPSSGKLYSASDDGELKVWDLNCEKMLQKYLVFDKEKKYCDQVTHPAEFYTAKACPLAMCSS